MSKEIFVKITNEQVLNDLKLMRECFGGFGFLYCYTDENIEQFEDLLTIKREVLFDISFFVEIAKIQNSWILKYAQREDLTQRENQYDQDFEGKIFEQILYRRCYLYHLKKRLDSLEKGSLYNAVSKEMMYYSSIPSIDPQSFNIKYVERYLLKRVNVESIGDLIDFSLDNLISFNKEKIIPVLKHILTLPNTMDEEDKQRLSNEIKRIKDLT